MASYTTEESKILQMTPEFSDSFWIFDLRLKDELGGASEPFPPDVVTTMTEATRNRRRRDSSGASCLVSLLLFTR